MRDSMPTRGAGAGAADDAGPAPTCDRPGGAGGVDPEPAPAPPVERTAWQLRVQARACAAMGSPLYAHLLTRAADDCAAAGPTWELLSPQSGAGRGDALALRLMAAVHWLVLEGAAPQLARHYPSAGGGGADPDGAWEAFRRTLSECADGLARLLRRPCQTNEVGRAAGLMPGFLDVARRTGLPLRLLEVGASAGLNLRCDHFRIGGGGVAVGDPASPVDLSGHWRIPPPDPGPGIRVVQRRGCDLRPVDPTSAEGRLTLTAAVWADQRARLDRLRGALELAQRHPAPVDRAALDVWTARQLAELPGDRATVVYHSVVLEYVPEHTRERFVAALREAGARATAARPLAWVRLEPVSALRHHGLEVTLWPGGDTRLLAVSGAHGGDVEWLGDKGTRGR